MSLVDFSLETSGRLMELDSRDGKLRVLYGDRLVTLLNEVRQLSVLGYEIPPKIAKCADVGRKFYQHGIELQAVNHLAWEISVKNFDFRSHIFTTPSIRK